MLIDRYILTTTPSAVEDHGFENQLVLDLGCEVAPVLKDEPLSLGTDGLRVNGMVTVDWPSIFPLWYFLILY